MRPLGLFLYQERPTIDQECRKWSGQASKEHELDKTFGARSR